MILLLYLTYCLSTTPQSPSASYLLLRSLLPTHYSPAYYFPAHLAYYSPVSHSPVSYSPISYSPALYFSTHYLPARYSGAHYFPAYYSPAPHYPIYYFPTYCSRPMAPLLTASALLPFAFPPTTFYLLLFLSLCLHLCYQIVLLLNNPMIPCPALLI